MHAMRITQNYLKLMTNAIDESLLLILRSEFNMFLRCSHYSVVEKIQGRIKNGPGFESEYDNAAEIAEYFFFAFVFI